MPVDDDPTDFEGIFPTVEDSENELSRRRPKTNAATGASAAGVRALSTQLVAFYFRAPVKAFFRTRVDWLVCDSIPKLCASADLLAVGIC